MRFSLNKSQNEKDNNKNNLSVLVLKKINTT